MRQQITKQQAEKLLEQRFLNKTVIFKHPAYPAVAGRCDRIFIGDAGRDKDLVLLIIGDMKYSVSPEMLNECLTLANNGNTATNGNDRRQRPSQDN